MTSQENFIREIYAFARRLLFYRLLNRLAWFGLLLLVLWLSVVAADQLFYFSQITRWGLWAIHWLVLIYLFWYFLYKPLKELFRLKHHSDLTPYARILSNIYNDPHEDLVTAYQLLTGKAQAGVSEVLKQKAIHAILLNYEQNNLGRQPRIRPFLPSLTIAGSILVSFMIFSVVHFTEFKRSTLRLLNPSQAYLPLPEYTFRVAPGDTTVIKGQNARVIVKYNGPEIQTCKIVYWNATLPENKQITAMRQAQGRYFFDFKNIRSEMVYAVQAEPKNRHLAHDIFTTRDYRINVRIPPEVQEVQITLQPPSYTRMPRTMLEKNVGDFSAVPGTKTVMRIRTNKELLSNAWLEFDAGKPKEIRLRGSSGTAEFFVWQEDSYRIFLQDTSGLKNMEPITYHISLLPDDPPQVEIIQPGQDIESVPDAILPIKIIATDDFGIRELWLTYRILSQGQAVGDTTWKHFNVPLTGIDLTRVESAYQFDFNQLPLAFGDVIEYFARVTDNRPRKLQESRSPVYKITFPTLDEMFQAFEQDQEQQNDRMKEVAEQAKELKQKLEEIEREMRREQKVDWEKKQQMEKALQRQKEMNEKVDEIRKNLEEAVKKLEENNLLSPEVLKKYQQLQELFREVVSPELLAAMQKLQNALEKPDPESVRQALQQFKINQEAFEKSIERTMELLRQVQFEQKLDQLVQRAKELKEQQEKISETLQEQKKPGKDELEQTAKRQAQQEQKLRQFARELENFRQEEMLAKYPQTQQMLDSLAGRLEEQRLGQQMQQVNQALKEQNISRAANQSQQVQNQLEQMEQALRQSQQSMQASHKQEIKKQMVQIMRRLLKLSQQEEALRKQTQRLSSTSDRFNSVAERQERVRRNLLKTVNDLLRLSRQTFFVSPRMNSLLNRAHRNMLQALDQLSERNQSGASRSETQAMGALNKSAMQMRQSISQLDQSQSGTGFEQFMEQLKQMAKAQGQINGQSMSLFQGQGNKGTYSQEQQAQMRRLAARQAALRQALQKMDEEMGQRNDLLGRMGKTAEEMEKVVQDLLKNNLNRQTIQRQQRILSRLLDAQKSMKEKEYSKKRKAERPENYLAKDPRVLGPTGDADKKRIEQAMRRALQEGYGKDMRILIENYFNQLLQKEEKDGG